jgi:predicted RNase H-like nuclease
MSRQAWAILPKIREVDMFVRSDPALQRWVREVHPEVCFWAWNGNTPMSHRKKSGAGRTEREQLVQPAYAEAYDKARTALPRGRYGNDDLLDAFAALWTAERFLTGTAVVLPEAPPLDAFGLRMEMIA